MSEGTKALRAVRLWDAWGRVLARGGDDITSLLDDIAAAGGDTSPRISARKPPTRIRLGLWHGATHGQLRLDLRVDFAGAPKAELELDGAVYRANTSIDGEDSSERRSVEFGGKFLVLHMFHEAVPRLMNAVYARSTFMPKLPALDDVARLSALETAVDVALGSAHRVHFEVRQGKDERIAFVRMGFDLKHANGEYFTEADEDRYQDIHGPNAGWPRGVAWRRADAIIRENIVSLGAGAGAIFR